MTYHPNRAAKLDWSAVRQIRHLYEEEGWTQGRLSREFGLGTAQVGRIVRYESWQEHREPPKEEFREEGSIALVQKLLKEVEDRREADRRISDDLDRLEGKVPK